jgi:hypothetical protein
LCLLIEKLPASKEQTDASVAASALMTELDKFLEKNNLLPTPFNSDYPYTTEGVPILRNCKLCGGLAKLWAGHEESCSTVCCLGMACGSTVSISASDMKTALCSNGWDIRHAQFSIARDLSIKRWNALNEKEG